MLLLMALMMVVLVVCVLLKVEPGRHPVDAAANHGFDDRVLRGLSFTVLSLLCLLQVHQKQERERMDGQ